MLHSNSFQFLIPTSKRSAMLPSDTSVGNGKNNTWAQSRCMTAVSEIRRSYNFDYQGFKACFDFNNQEYTRVWQIPD